MNIHYVQWNEFFDLFRKSETSYSIIHKRVCILHKYAIEDLQKFSHISVITNVKNRCNKQKKKKKKPELYKWRSVDVRLSCLQQTNAGGCRTLHSYNFERVGEATRNLKQVQKVLLCCNPLFSGKRGKIRVGRNQ